jgi:hypothetical protein
MNKHLTVMVEKSPNLAALMSKIGLSLYMVQRIEIGSDKFDGLILTEEIANNKCLMSGDKVTFYPRKMTRFSMDFASDR